MQAARHDEAPAEQNFEDELGHFSTLKPGGREYHSEHAARLRIAPGRISSKQRQSSPHWPYQPTLRADVITGVSVRMRNRSPWVFAQRLSRWEKKISSPA